MSSYLKEGVLTKRSASAKLITNWRKRYFALTPTELLYFEKKDDAEPGRRTPLGPDASISRTNDRGYKLCFVVKSTPTAEPFYIQAASEDELKEWVDAIGKVVGKIEDLVNDGAAKEPEAAKVDEVGKEDVVEGGESTDAPAASGEATDGTPPTTEGSE
ncbi:hypothetical protein SDRG_10966 [Saprolegnia diclina VS20]|uniref:PH domain-containing protein n=1 Tax=Saprolegnia diclina (strain VS20) TaxID=1156394 RepID=T0Q0J4_SAPDV|nr:hypothetical protein SDRG_10966 [Saprolegnia diclina VS20]EQC31364.1 hypothetical protein SDRG_10966 [Saprolegnia diclina VS20]|eukprot:XP_008615205.1 hypothetical protein SDRG_10966 [Saprolegnia diclina VS20]